MTNTTTDKPSQTANPASARPRIAVIGAGLAAAAFVTALASRAQLAVFEKSRGYGGRMAVRRRDSGMFNHGAQFFTARSDAFKGDIGRMTAAGVVAEWQPRLLTFDGEQKPFKREWFEPHYVATGGMSTVARNYFDAALDAGSELSVNTGLRIEKLSHQQQVWFIDDEQGQQHGPFDWVVSAIPAPQLGALLEGHAAFSTQVEKVEFSPCFSLLLQTDATLRLPFDAAVVRNSPLAWISSESSRPGHDAAPLYTLHSDNRWAAANLEKDAFWIGEQLKAAFCELAKIDSDSVVDGDLHRWRYARCERPLDQQDYLLDPVLHIAACGDWCRGNRVEDAFISGRRLGLALAEQLASQ